MICKRCGKDKAPDDFRINVTRRRELTPTIIRRTICKICEVDIRPGNVQWLCLTCNRRKQRRSGMEDGLERVMVRQWIADEPPDAHGQQALF